MRTLLAPIIALALPSAALAAELESAAEGYARILATHVRGGRVDYKGIAARDLPALDRYLDAVAKAELPKARGMRIGFLVDAYNALVIRSVLRHDRPRSVLDVPGFFDRETHSVAGRELSLDALEKQVLNPYAKDPRTHFVLVCAAVGCPILEAKPFQGSDIEARLEAATRRYLRSPTGARWEGDRLLLSKIFDWYAGDFGGKSGVIQFVKARLPPAQASELTQMGDTSFLDYNWTLNQR